MEASKRDAKVERAIEFIRAQKEVDHEDSGRRNLNDARQRASGLRPAQAHDRDLISQYPEWEIAQRHRETKARER